MRFALALCVALLLPAVVAAQPIDQDGAQQLRQDLQSWLTGLLGPGHVPSSDWLRVTPEDDHFRLAVPLTAASPPADVTANVRPLPGGLWSVDALRMPPAARFNLTVPVPGGPPGATEATHLDVRIGSQHAQGLVSPTLTAPSQLDLELGNVALVTNSAHQHQEQHFDRYTVHATLQPDGSLLDLIERGSIAGWRSASRVDDKPAVGFGADRIAASGRIDGIDRAHATALLGAAVGLVAALPPGAATHHGRPELSPPARAALRALVESLRGILTAIRGEETIEGLHVAVAGYGETTVRRTTLAFSGAAPDGMLHAGMTLALDGLSVQRVPPEAAALMPQHVLVKPSIAGVSVAALTALALAATEPHVNDAQLQADAEALLARGGVTGGLDALDLDIGPTVVHGRGQVTVTAPGEYEAHAHIAATGLDKLMQQAATNPSLQRALPLLAMARGFARQQGDYLVWDIVANPAGVTVNDVPLGGGGAHPDRR